MNKIIYTLVICLTMTNEFAVCATRGGVVALQEDDLPNQRVEVSPRTQVFEAVSVNQLGQDYVQAERVEVLPQAQAIPMGAAIHDLVDARLEEINRKYSVHGDRPDGSLDRDYAITLLVEMADVLRVAYGKPGRDFTELVENMQEIQRFRARYPGCEELQKVCDQLQSDEAKEMISIIRRYQLSRRASRMT